MNRSMAKTVSAKALIVLAATLSGGQVFSAETAVAGVIKKNEGTVEIIRDGKTIPAGVGTQVMAGDVLKTSAGSTAGVMLKDETRISVGANSQVGLDKFAFNADTNKGNMLVSIAKGTFAMISGLVVKNNPGAAQVKTPTTTAGVRGTSFVVEVP